MRVVSDRDVLHTVVLDGRLLWCVLTYAREMNSGGSFW